MKQVDIGFAVLSQFKAEGFDAFALPTDRDYEVLKKLDRLAGYLSLTEQQALLYDLQKQQ